MNEYLFVNSIRSSFDLLCATSSALHQYTETVSECLNPFLARIFFMRCLVFMCSHFFFKSIPKIEFLLKYSIHFSFTPSLSSSSQSNVYHPFFVRFCFESNMLSWFHSTGNVMARACVCYISSLFCNWNQRSCELLKTECQLTIETKKTLPSFVACFYFCVSLLFCVCKCEIEIKFNYSICVHICAVRSVLFVGCNCVVISLSFPPRVCFFYISPDYYYHGSRITCV